VPVFGTKNPRVALTLALKQELSIYG
jgi:hypothetical protein